MARPARALPKASPAPAAVLHRRRQRVVVTARTIATLGAVLAPGERRGAAETMPGLGFRAVADTLPVPADGPEDEPVSHVRTRVAPRPLTLLPPPPSSPVRRRPITLLDEVHDAMSRQYLEEAERLIASGIFEDHDALD